MPKIDREYLGTWHIYKMDIWSDGDASMKTFINVEEDGGGSFQIGLVSGELDGTVTYYPEGKRFEYSWLGRDKSSMACGWGWFKKKDYDTVDGYIKIHLGDETKFTAKRLRK